MATLILPIFIANIGMQPFQKNKGLKDSKSRFAAVTKLSYLESIKPKSLDIIPRIYFGNITEPIIGAIVLDTYYESGYFTTEGGSPYFGDT